jgi:hypothetical protein
MGNASWHRRKVEVSSIAEKRAKSARQCNRLHLSLAVLQAAKSTDESRTLASHIKEGAIVESAVHHFRPHPAI